MELEPDTFNAAAKGDAPPDMWPRTRAAFPKLLQTIANTEYISCPENALDKWLAGLHMGVKAAYDDSYRLKFKPHERLERHYLYFYDSCLPADNRTRDDAFILAMRQGEMHAFEMPNYYQRYRLETPLDSMIKELSFEGACAKDTTEDELFLWRHISGRRKSDIRRGIESVITDITRYVVRYRLSPNGKPEEFIRNEFIYMSMIARPLYDDVCAYLRQQVLRVDPAYGDLLLDTKETEAYNWAYRAQNEEIKARRAHAVRQWGRSVHGLLFPFDPIYHSRNKSFADTRLKITLMPRHIERDIDAGMDAASVAATSLGISPAFFSAHVRDLYSHNGTFERYYSSPMLLLPLLEQLPEAEWLRKKKSTRWDSLYNLMRFAEDVVGRMQFSDMEAEPNVVGPFWAALARHIDPQSIRLFLNTPYRLDTASRDYYNGCIYPHSKRNVEHLQSIFDRTDVVEGIGKYLLMPTLHVILKDMGMREPEIQKIAGDIQTLAQGLYNGMSGQVDAARMIETWYNVMPVIQIKAFGQTLLDGTAGKPVADTEIIKAYGYDPREADIAGAVLDMFRPLLPTLLQDADTITDVIMAALPHSELGKKLQALHGKVERQVRRVAGPQLRL